MRPHKHVQDRDKYYVCQSSILGEFQVHSLAKDRGFKNTFHSKNIRLHRSDYSDVNTVCTLQHYGPMLLQSVPFHKPH